MTYYVRTGLTSPCGHMKCDCKFESPDGIIDCYNRNLTKVPHFTKDEVFLMKYMTLDQNNIRRVHNDTFRRDVFTSLLTLYLRNNPNLDCRSIQDNIPSWIEVISDCGFTSYVGTLNHTNIQVTTPITVGDVTNTTNIQPHDKDGHKLALILPVTLFSICATFSILTIFVRKLYIKAKMERLVGNSNSSFELFDMGIASPYRETTEIA